MRSKMMLKTAADEDFFDDVFCLAACMFSRFVWNCDLIFGFIVCFVECGVQISLEISTFVGSGVLILRFLIVFCVSIANFIQI